MNHVKLFESFNQFSTSSNIELISLISYFGKRLKSYSDRNMKDHYHYKNAISGLGTLKDEINDRIKRNYTSEEDEIGKISNDVLREILRKEGSIQFSVGMFKTIIKTINATLKNNEFTPVVEDGNDYVLYDEEKEYLNDIFKKYMNERE